MEKPFEHVVIVGCGLLGTSLGLALRKHKLASVITGVGRAGSSSVTVAQQRGAIDRRSDDVALAVGAGIIDGISAPPADLVVVCVPIRQFPELFKAIGPKLQPQTLVTDVGSTKTQVMQWADALLPQYVDFIGSHPMAGSEKTGPEAARDNLYERAVCLLCRPVKAKGTTDAAFARIAGMWQAIGMRVTACSPTDHDQRVAAVSHLPHALSFSLMLSAGRDPAALEAAAGGFTDMTRIAGSDPTMWLDIFLTNRDAVLETIGKFSNELSTLKTALEARDETAIREFLLAAKKTRETFIEGRKKRGA